MKTENKIVEQNSVCIKHINADVSLQVRFPAGDKAIRRRGYVLPPPPFLLVSLSPSPYLSLSLSLYAFLPHFGTLVVLLDSVPG